MILLGVQPYSVSVDTSPYKKTITTFISKFTLKNERKVLRIFLLRYFHNLFLEVFRDEIQFHLNNNYVKELYVMDNQIIQFLIQSIVATGDYTLEGIAYYTRLPFDVIYEAGCGIANEVSMTLWTRIIDLYIKVKPEMEKILVTRLIEIRDRYSTAFSDLLSGETNEKFHIDNYKKNK